MTSEVTWTVLGSGTAKPHPRRAPPGHLLRSRHSTIAVDLGAGTLWRMAGMGVDWTTLDAVVLSHAHLDHTLDLQALMFAAAIPGHGRQRPLPVIMGPGMDDFVGRVRTALGKWFVPKGFDVHWRVFDQGHLQLTSDVELYLGQVEHHHTSIGMRFDVAVSEGSVCLAYSGDSAACDSLVDLCRGVELAVLECSTPPDDLLPGHMTPREVARVARDAQVGQVALVHRYPELDTIDAQASVAEFGYDGSVHCVEDGQVLPLDETTHSRHGKKAT